MSPTQMARRIDWLMVAVMAALMVVSLLVISAYSAGGDPQQAPFFTAMVRVQLQWFALGTLVFLGAVYFDYNKLREWTWPLYLVILLALLGLFFTDSVQRVHRWYKIPFINFSFQPSEYAKLVVVITLSWYLERQRQHAHSLGAVGKALLIVGIPFVLIVKQPDLGTALVLFPITLVMFYLGDVHPWVVRCMMALALAGTAAVATLFLGIVSREQVRPAATLVLKEYQFDRLDPSSHQQTAAATAIAVGGLTGVGWRHSTFTAGGWLPTPYTDSVFPAFGEEFGLVGLFLLLALYYLLIYRCYQAALVAKDPFGRLLAAGIATYLAMHILVNIGMMTGFLPITGVPLVLVTYGGSSVLATMTALGIVQSVYVRRFMF